MRFWNIILGLSFCCFTTLSSLSAQVEALNSEGEKILVYADGSWKYADPEKEAQRQAILNPQAAQAKSKKQKAPKAPAYTREEMVAAREHLAAAFRKAKKEREDALSDTRQTEQELAEYTASKALDIKNKTLSPQEKKSYDSRVNFLKNKIKRAKKSTKAARKREKLWQSLLTKSGEKMMGLYDKKKDQIDKELGVVAAVPKEEKKKGKDKMSPQEIARADYEEKLAEIRKKAEEETAQKLSDARLRSRSLEKYLRLRQPPQGECGIAFDEVDPLTGKRKRAVKAGRLLSHLNEENESLLKGQGYVTCDAFVSELNDGKELILVLDFTILTKDAYSEFGGLQKNSKLGMVFLDGSQIVLKNRQADKGEVDAALGKTHFRGYYNLPKGDAKQLETGELNFLRVYWGNGFEDYEILEMDFFRHQLHCLRKFP